MAVKQATRGFSPYFDGIKRQCSSLRLSGGPLRRWIHFGGDDLSAHVSLWLTTPSRAVINMVNQLEFDQSRTRDLTPRWSPRWRSGICAHVMQVATEAIPIVYDTEFLQMPTQYSQWVTSILKFRRAFFSPSPVRQTCKNGLELPFLHSLPNWKAFLSVA
jgi:hypothetical protein